MKGSGNKISMKKYEKVIKSKTFILKKKSTGLCPCNNGFETVRAVILFPESLMKEFVSNRYFFNSVIYISLRMVKQIFIPKGIIIKNTDILRLLWLLYELRCL